MVDVVLVTPEGNGMTTIAAVALPTQVLAVREAKNEPCAQS